MDSSLGKMPTTSVGRPISLLTRSSERAAELGPVLAGESVDGDQVLLGALEQPAHLGGDRLKAGDHVGDPLAGLVLVFGVEDLAQGGGDQAALVAAAVIEHV
jgi:hypothetical protein